MPILKTALAYLAAGLAPLPIKDDGSKQPLVKWLDYQERAPELRDINRWFGNGQDGLGVVTGAVSGGLEVIDIDAAELVQPFLAAVEQAMPGLIERLPRERTPRNGAHLFYRCPGHIEQNQKLARSVTKSVLIETRGEGGFCVTAPTTGRYHATGNPYEMEHGELVAIPQITQEERDALLAIARSYNQYIQPSHAPSAGNGDGNGEGNRPGDDFNERATWADVLEPHGWKMLRVQAKAEIWQRPGKDGPGGSAIAGGKSPRTGFGELYVYSSNALPFEPEQGYTKFHAYALLNHNGDYKEAAKTLAKAGYGDPLPARKLSEPDPLIYDELSEVLGDPATLHDLAFYKQTDMGNGEAFVRIFGNRFRLDHLQGKKDKGTWLRWGGQRWETDVLGEVYRSAKLLARARAAAGETIADNDIRKKALEWAHSSEQRARVEAMLWAASTMPPISVTTTMFDNDIWLLSCGNGTLDLRTGTLQKPSPADMITRGTMVEYLPWAQAPRFLQFLSEVFGGNEAIISFMQRAIGYSLTGDTREQVLFLCWGSGANGKGVLFNTLRAVLGSLADDTAFGTFEVTKSESSNDLAKLAGARLVTASETGENKRLNETRIKTVTGHDPVTCRFLFNEFFTYVPNYKIWLAMNHKPEIRGTDRGIWRRIRLIPFNVSFEGREDKELESKLLAELPGILAWAVEGCMAWQREGLNPPREVLEATLEYQRESDLVGRFLDERTIKAELGGVGATALYQVFAAWSRANGEDVITSTAFGRRMTEKGYIRETYQTVRYKGLQLKDVDSAVEQSDSRGRNDEVEQIPF